MSTSYKAEAVVGVPFSELYEERVMTMEEVRYDPKTGQALPKKVKVETKQWFWMGQELEEPFDDREAEVERRLGMDLISCGGGYNDDDVEFVGRKLGEADPGGSFSCPILELDGLRSEVGAKLTSLGWRGEVKLHVLCYVG